MSVLTDVSRIEGISMVGKNEQMTNDLAGRIFRARISSSGQVTIPVEIRKKLGVEKNEEVNFEVSDDAVVVKRPMTWDEFAEKQQARVEELKRKNPKFAKALEKNKGKTANEMRDEWMASSEGKAYYKEKYGI